MMAFNLRLVSALCFVSITSPALAQEVQSDGEENASEESAKAPTNVVTGLLEGKSDYNIMIGMGPRTKAAFPGADHNKILPLPIVNVWRDSERFPVSTPDESFGLALIGKRGRASFGPTLSFATQRKGKDAIEGLSDVGFGVEVGGFVETFVAPMLRVRGEMRQSIGGHKGLTADLSVDGVVRSANDKLTVTIGPRMRWANGKYNRAFFGVDTEDATATGLSYYRPKSGVYAYGVMTGAYYQFNDQWGAFGFAAYDRLTGDAAKSPIVTEIGSRNQFSAGIAATYKFKIKRR